MFIFLLSSLLFFFLIFVILLQKRDLGRQSSNLISEMKSLSIYNDQISFYKYWIITIIIINRFQYVLEIIIDNFSILFIQISWKGLRKEKENRTGFCGVTTFATFFPCAACVKLRHDNLHKKRIWRHWYPFVGS